MAVALLCRSILGVALLYAPDPHDQRGVHPPGHESNIELCRSVWRDQPQKQERCLIARRDLVETLERNPYAHPPEAATSTPCHGWRKGYTEEGGLPRTIMERCDKSLLEEAASLSFWYNYFHSAVADAVMWDDQQQASDARRYLGRLLWCDSKSLSQNMLL